MIVSIAELYSYFQEGDFPSEAQFKNLIDTLWSNGVIVLPGTTTSYTVDKGRFVDVIVIEATTPDEFTGVKIGRTVGGEEWQESHTIVEKGVYRIDEYCRVATTIYFTNVNANAIIKIYTK